jgi:hypothetical protein
MISLKLLSKVITGVTVTPVCPVMNAKRRAAGRTLVRPFASSSPASGKSVEAAK